MSRIIGAFLFLVLTLAPCLLGLSLQSLSTKARKPLSFQVQVVLLQNISCFGQSTGQATVQTTGGIPPYSYFWSTGQNTATILGLSAGPYQVTVVDGSGQSDSSSLVISQPASMQGTLQAISNYGGGNVSCLGAADGSAELTSISGGQPPYQYLWGNGQTTTTATGLSAGTQALSVTDAAGCLWVGNVVLQAPAPVQLQLASAGNINCFGGNNGEIAVQPIGGTAAYSFLWSNGQTGFTAWGFGAGTHSVTVTDANGCQATASLSLTQPPPLQIGFSATQPASCSNTADAQAIATSSGGTGPLQVTWSNGELGDTALALPPNQNIVATVTDANNCTATASISLNAPSPLLATLNQLGGITCANDSTAVLQASASGGSPNYQFQWSTGATTAVVDSLGTGSYSVTVTDANGCTNTAQQSITALNALNITLLSSSSASCFGQSDGAATVAVTGGSPPYSYFWTSGETGPSAVQLLGGLRRVTVTDANGCSNSLNVLIEQPNDLLALNNGIRPVSCFGGSDGAVAVRVFGGVGPYSYNWSNGGTTPSQNNLSAGAYTVLINDANGCTTAFAAIVEQPTDSAQLQVLAKENATCADRNDAWIELLASGGTPGYTIIWNAGQLNTNGAALIEDLDANDYTLTLVDANRCKDTLQVELTAPASLNLSSVLEGPSCYAGADAQIAAQASGGTPPYLYALANAPASTDSIFSNLSAGNYYLEVQDVRGCADSAWLSIANPDTIALYPSPDGRIQLGETLPLQVNLPINITDNLPIEWRPSAGLDCDSCYAVEASPVETTNYEIEVSDLNGCISKTAIRVEVDKNRGIFIPDIFSPNGDGLNDGFTAYGGIGVDRIEEMLLFDRWGKRLFQGKELPIGNESSGWDGSYQGAVLNPGVFVYRIRIRFLDGEIREFAGDVTLIY